MRERNDETNRFRLTDLFLILLLLLCIAGMIFRHWSIRHNASEQLQSFSVTAVWKNVDNRTAACLQEGDWLYTAAGETFGQIMGAESRPAEVRLTEGGNWYEGAWPDDTRSDVYLTVSVRAKTGEGTLLRGGTHPLSVGQTCQLYSGRAEVLLFVRSYAPVSAEEAAAPGSDFLLCPDCTKKRI